MSDTNTTTWEVYFSEEHDRDYFYNTETQESVWEKPTTGTIVDKKVPEQTEAQKRAERIKQLQKENFEAMNQELLEQSEELTKEEAMKLIANPTSGHEASDKFVTSLLEKTQEWLQRPAKRQVTDTSKNDVAYLEGNYEYNIWYDKYLTDMRTTQKRMPALHKCNPEEDAGFTKADTLGNKKQSSTWFCTYFARGCCTEGTNCRYYHRIPNSDDCKNDKDNSKDVFGRARHASNKMDNTGVGSFNHPCTTLFFTGLPIPT